MILFLDVISPIPKFFIIEDNKLIFQQKIVFNNNDKISDSIFETFIPISNEFNLNKNLKKTIITKGPGSYTSLRIGTAFISGISINRDIVNCSISPSDIIEFKSDKFKKNSIGIFISSSNQQKFFCKLNKDNKMQYLKIDNNEYSIPKEIDIIYFNDKKLIEKNNLQQYKFSFINEILINIKKLKFKSNEILKPIYVSNNNILN